MSDINTKLGMYRHKIDAIDKEIVALLKQRIEIVKDVGALKSAQSDGLNFIRPGREATMLRDLIKKTKGTLPAEAVFTIWRMIISSALMIEQHMHVYAYATKTDQGCYWLAREYYGNFVPLSQESSVEAIIGKVVVNPQAVGILPFGGEGSKKPWWLRPSDEKNDVYVFARVPFVVSQGKNHGAALAIASVRPENSKDDRSVMVISHENKASITKACEKAGLAISYLAQYKSHHLVECDVFIPIGDKRISVLRKTFGGGDSVRLLGSYAAPIVL